MNIITKFNLKQTVWFMKDNKPVNAIVSAIYTFNFGTSQDSIKYNLKQSTPNSGWLDFQNIPENVLYESKEQLLSSL